MAVRTRARVTPAGPSCSRMRNWADGPSLGLSLPGFPVPSLASPESTTKWRQHRIGFPTSLDSQPCHDKSMKLDRFSHLWTITFRCKTTKLFSVSSTDQNETKVNQKLYYIKISKTYEKVMFFFFFIFCNFYVFFLVESNRLIKLYYICNVWRFQVVLFESDVKIVKCFNLLISCYAMTVFKCHFVLVCGHLMSSCDCQLKFWFLDFLFSNSKNSVLDLDWNWKTNLNLKSTFENRW